jgi:exosome complex RNA-binding protein Rrp42 (RNase PH superfamily)
MNKPHVLLSHIRLFTDSETPPILDPSQLGATLSSSAMTLAMNAQRELCMVQKAGGVPMAVDEIPRYGRSVLNMEAVLTCFQGLACRR